MHVDIGKGLIQKQELGIVQNGPREGHPLPHALRILADGPRQLWVKTHGADHFGTAFIAGDFIQPREIAQILHPAHFVVEQRGMRHVANFAGTVLRILAEHANRSLRRVS